MGNPRNKQEIRSAVLAAIEQIVDRDMDQGDELLAAFLCAAWPTATAQNS